MKNSKEKKMNKFNVGDVLTWKEETNPIIKVVHIMDNYYAIRWLHNGKEELYVFKAIEDALQLAPYAQTPLYKKLQGQHDG